MDTFIFTYLNFINVFIFFHLFSFEIYLKKLIFISLFGITNKNSTF